MNQKSGTRIQSANESNWTARCRNLQVEPTDSSYNGRRRETSMTSWRTFLEHPGRPGPFGALLDEYARAGEELCKLVETFDAGAFQETRESDASDTWTISRICRHVCEAGRSYALCIRHARGMDEVQDLGDIVIKTPADFRSEFAKVVRLTADAVSGMEDADLAQLRFPVRWGPEHNPEMLLEHAIVHVLRHRRQLERW